MYLRQVFKILINQKLYINLKKCRSFTDSLVFLGYVLSKDRIKRDPSKVEEILISHFLSLLNSIQSFHGPTSFYLQFIRRFSIVVTSITECLKEEGFKWTKKHMRVLEKVPVLLLPDLCKVLKVEYDASNIGLELYVLRQ